MHLYTHISSLMKKSLKLYLIFKIIMVAVKFRDYVIFQLVYLCLMIYILWVGSYLFLLLIPEFSKVSDDMVENSKYLIVLKL